MLNPLELEFVLVSDDYATMTTLSGGIKKYGAKFIVVPTAEAARDCLNRRKIDGVFVDTGVSGALTIIEGIRKGSSNSKVVIFACVKSSKEYTQTLSAGANFLLRKPLNEESIALHITIAKELLERERRRYFRHPLNLPVRLTDAGGEQHARMTNLSEGGMAVRLVRPLRHSTVVDFEFELSKAVSISGKGQVSWVNTEGLAGIILQMFRGTGKTQLEAWLAAQDELAGK
jgi:ActR/RegA family two-component response regulator